MSDFIHHQVTLSHCLPSSPLPLVSMFYAVLRGRSLMIRSSRRFHTARTNLESRKEKPSLPLRESMDIDDGKLSNFFISASIIGTLALGTYLDSHDYMHARDHGVVQATPGILRFITDAIDDNVPGAYDKRQ
jgi:hypothetical protein